MLSPLCFWLSLSGLFCLLLGLILCVLCLGHKGTCLLPGRDLVLHFLKSSSKRSTMREMLSSGTREACRVANTSPPHTVLIAGTHSTFKPMGCPLPSVLTRGTSLVGSPIYWYFNRVPCNSRHLVIPLPHRVHWSSMSLVANMKLVGIITNRKCPSKDMGTTFSFTF